MQKLPPLVEITDLSSSLFTNLHLVIPANTIVGLMGKSGSGKSTLALSIGSLQTSHMTITKGKMQFVGKDLLKMQKKQTKKLLGKKIGYIFQDPFSSLHPCMTIGKQIMETPIIHGMKKKQAKEWMRELLSLVGLKGKEHIYPHQLSGGQKQRVCISIALSGKPDLIVADEPTTALDPITQKEVLDLLLLLKKKVGFSILFISHDRKVINYVSDIAYLLQNRRLFPLSLEKEGKEYD